jgi:DNA replication protein
MSNNILEGLIKAKDYTFKRQLFKIVADYNLSINELLLLIYFMNLDIPTLNVPEIKKETLLSEKSILESFSLLSSKGVLAIKMEKGKDGKVTEVLDLSNLYKAMVSEINLNIKKKTESNIFEIFEKEFSRTLSPMEYEMINAWISSGMDEEMIIGALKEATFNGVSNLRYIDRIIYEWGKKGFKNMNDVKVHMENRNKKTKKDEPVLFDYNWLEDED